MTVEKKSQRTNADYFAKKTYKEVTLWDWLGRVLPMSVLAVIVVCYYFKWHNALDLVLEIATILFFIICFIWWYWAIYKIAVTAHYIKNAQDRFKSLTQELKKFKKDINAGDRERREP